MLPAAFAAVSAAASWAITTLSAARRAALRDTLEGGAQRALDRYLESGPVIEARWLVIRTFGIAISALLVGESLPAWLGNWRLIIAAAGALLAYAFPSEVARRLVARKADTTAPLLLQVLRPLEWLAAPIAAPIAWVGNLVRLSAVPPQAPTPGVTETEVELIVNEGELNGSLGHDQSEMIRNVLDFGDATAGELMIPRPQVTAFDISTPIDGLLRQIVESEHSRYPIYKETIDNVIGVLHAKDLLRYALAGKQADVRVEAMLRQPVVFVPESQLATSVLKDMRAGRHHMAVVIDEFGGFSGIITLEDLLEEIVGDIRDEHDVEEAPIIDIGDGKLMVDASVSMSDLSRYLGAELPEDGDYHTLAGFIVAELGRVPEPGATLRAFGLDFTVREADERRVSKVEIARMTPPESISPRSSSRITAA
ncbi:MAG TPA: hemolysin family protein [Polyangiaceae bacterium]|jgi:CBS domain containing-hemolysin-like protein